MENPNCMRAVIQPTTGIVAKAPAAANLAPNFAKRVGAFLSTKAKNCCFCL